MAQSLFPLSHRAKHCPHFSSPLVGEDSGGGESRASLHPHPHRPPSRGRGKSANRAALNADAAIIRRDVGKA